VNFWPETLTKPVAVLPPEVVLVVLDLVLVVVELGLVVVVLLLRELEVDELALVDEEVAVVVA
jgi:hypothetical protein